jgi:hypothetical protein
MSMDISFEAEIVKNAICEEAAIIRGALTAPHVLYKPTLHPDGTKWCALFGADLATGVAGFGDTPAEAMADFDRAWGAELTPAAALQARKIADEDQREEVLANSQFGAGA